MSNSDRAESKRFRSTAGFGKRIEYWIVGRMLKEGMDVYIPLVDDHAVMTIVRRPDGSIALVQVKARSKDVVEEMLRYSRRSSMNTATTIGSFSTRSGSTWYGS